MDVNKKRARVFIDIERWNKVDGSIAILEISATKTISEGKFEKINLKCHQEKPIPYMLGVLLNKPTNYYKRFTLTEEQAIKQFLKFVDGCEIWTYGDHDKTLIVNKLKEYNIDTKITINDYARKIKFRLGEPFIGPKNTPSQNNLLNIFKIVNYNEHNALNDAISLSKLFYASKSFNKDEMIKSLAIEMMRPRITYLTNEVVNKHIKTNLSKNYYCIYVEHHNLKNKKLFKSDNKEEFDLINEYSTIFKVVDHQRNIILNQELKIVYDNQEQVSDYLLRNYPKEIFKYVPNSIVYEDLKEEHEYSIHGMYRKLNKNDYIEYYKVKTQSIDIFKKIFSINNHEDILVNASIMLDITSNFLDVDKRNFNRMVDYNKIKINKY